MSRPLPVAVVQAAPGPPEDALDALGAEVAAVVGDHPRTRLVVYPELHVYGVDDRAADRDARLEALAEPLDGPCCRRLAELAGDLGVWLVPGTVCERGDDGRLYNTAVAFSPEGRLVASYRKIFPWRPFEPYEPGDAFVVFDVPGTGRLGLSICYDAWFPETTRHLAWMGAEAVLNLVRTTTTDRAQELVLARANAIVNQVFVVSVNCAAPVGRGQSLVVDPEGTVRVATGESATVLTDVLDLDHVTRARTYGTAGLNRMWDQLRPGDRPIELPLYQGRMESSVWTAPPAAPRP